MNTLDFKIDNYGKTRKIRIVDEFPIGYYVWSIGRMNFPFEGHIPVVRKADDPFHIRPETLTSVRMDKELADFMLDYAHYKEIGYFEFLDLKKQFSIWKRNPIDLIKEIELRFQPNSVYQETWMNEWDYDDAVRKHAESMLDSIIIDISFSISVSKDFILYQIKYKQKNELIDSFSKSIIEYTRNHENKSL